MAGVGRMLVLRKWRMKSSTIRRILSRIFIMKKSGYFLQGSCFFLCALSVFHFRVHRNNTCERSQSKNYD
jgi:hypothetical protein